MLSTFQILASSCYSPAKFKTIVLTREWANNAPDEAGVYAIAEREEIVYVGETRSLRGRMRDLLDSHTHLLDEPSETPFAMAMYNTRKQQPA